MISSVYTSWMFERNNSESAHLSIITISYIFQMSRFKFITMGLILLIIFYAVDFLKELYSIINITFFLNVIACPKLLMSRKTYNAGV